MPAALSLADFKLRISDGLALTIVIVVGAAIAMAFLARQGLLPRWLSLARASTSAPSRSVPTALQSKPRAAPAAAALSSSATSGPTATATLTDDDTRVHGSSPDAPAPIVRTEAVTPDQRGSGSGAGRRPAGLPSDVSAYRRTGVMTESTVPAGLLRSHTTRAGTWGLIHVEEGQLMYRVTDPRRPASERLLTPDVEAGVIEPTVLHSVEPIGHVKFFVEFHKADAPATATAAAPNATG